MNIFPLCNHPVFDKKPALLLLGQIVLLHMGRVGATGGTFFVDKPEAVVEVEIETINEEIIGTTENGILDPDVADAYLNAFAINIAEAIEGGRLVFTLGDKPFALVRVSPKKMI